MPNLSAMKPAVLPMILSTLVLNRQPSISSAFSPLPFQTIRSNPSFVGSSLKSKKKKNHHEESSPSDNEHDWKKLELSFFQMDESYLGQDEPNQGGRWKLQNDFYTFLNQCSIQSFAFLLKSMHDPQTVLWMENFTQPALEHGGKLSIQAAEGVGAHDNDMVVPRGGASEDCLLLNYHGLNAIDMTRFPSWDSFFIKLIEQPVEQYTIESSTLGVPDYDMDINPPRLCNRIVAVREQIAREFAHDLQVLSKMGDETLQAHYQSLDKRDDDMSDPDDKDGREIKIEETNYMFLDLSVDLDYDSSPLRKGNFDLLKLLATQEAIHRILNNPEQTNGDEAVPTQFLDKFYSDRLLTFFAGDQEYNSADRFLRELLNESELQNVQGQTAMINPTRLAEMIIEKRRVVALEWKAMAGLVPEEHMVIRRLQLDQMLTGTGSGGQSFEQALKGGDTQEQQDTSATMPFFPPPPPPVNLVPPPPPPRVAPVVQQRELVGSGANSTSVFE